MAGRGALIPGGPAQSAGHRRAAALRRALRRPVRPARRRAARPIEEAAGKDHGPVAPRRVRRHRAARPGPGLVLADPGRDGRHRARLPRDPPGAGPAGAHPRGAGRPAVAGRRAGLGGRPGVVAFRTAAARRPARGRPPRARPGRRDPLAQHRRQPVRRAGLGHRGRADPQADRPDHRDHDRAAVPDAVRHGRVPDRPGRPPGGAAGRGLASARGADPGRGPGPARRRVHPGAISELEGRGAAWTEERGTSDEGRRRAKAPRRRAGDTR